MVKTKTCKHSGLKFEDSGRRRVHPEISDWWNHSDLEKRLAAQSVIMDGKEEGWESFEKFEVAILAKINKWESIDKEEEEKKREREEQEGQEKVAHVVDKLAKLPKPAPLSAVGNLLAEYISSIPPFSASSWLVKKGDCRVYVRDNSMTRSARGFYLVELTSDGRTYLNGRNCTAVFPEEMLANLKSLFSSIEVTNDLSAPEVRVPRSYEEIQRALQAGENVGDKEIQAALDRDYGKGGWDDRDRIDYEG